MVALTPHPSDLLESLTTAVVALGDDGRVSRMNGAAQALLGLSERSVAGRSLSQLLPAAGPLDELVARARATAATVVQRGLPLALAPNVDRLLDVSATPIGGGTLLELVDRARETRIARDASILETTGVTRGLVRRLAHEVKNPLGGLRGAAQLLSRRLEDEESLRFTEVIIQEADRLRELVDAMLGPSTPPRREPVNVHSVLEHVREVVLPGLPEGVSLERAYDPSLPELQADAAQLTQAVMNLVVNACQAVGDAGRVTLISQPLRQFTIGEVRHRLVVCIGVEDDGPGVPDDLADRIFYPLVSGRSDGTGLGLALAQELIQRQGGLIEFESRPGRTRFDIVLPLIEGAQP